MTMCCTEAFIRDVRKIRMFAIVVYEPFRMITVRGMGIHITRKHEKRLISISGLQKVDCFICKNIALKTIRFINAALVRKRCQPLVRILPVTIGKPAIEPLMRGGAVTAMPLTDLRSFITRILQQFADISLPLKPRVIFTAVHLLDPVMNPMLRWETPTVETRSCR